MTLSNSLRTQPDDHGHFGAFGGRYVAETLMPLILDLEREYNAAKVDPSFAADMARMRGGARLWLSATRVRFSCFAT